MCLLKELRFTFFSGRTDGLTDEFILSCTLKITRGSVHLIHHVSLRVVVVVFVVVECFPIINRLATSREGLGHRGLSFLRHVQSRAIHQLLRTHGQKVYRLSGADL